LVPSGTTAPVTSSGIRVPNPNSRLRSLPGRGGLPPASSDPKTTH
jgi:hypothetical protein